MAEQIHSVSRWSKRRSFTHSLTVTVTHSHSSVRWLAFGGHSLTHSLTHCHPLTVFTEYNDDERTNERTSTLLWSPIIDRSVVRSFVRSFVCLPSFVVRCSSSSFVCHHSFAIVRSFIRSSSSLLFVCLCLLCLCCLSFVGWFVRRSFVRSPNARVHRPATSFCSLSPSLRMSVGAFVFISAAVRRRRRCCCCCCCCGGGDGLAGWPLAACGI